MLVLCSGPLCVPPSLLSTPIPDNALRENLPGPSGSAFLQACDNSYFLVLSGAHLSSDYDPADGKSWRTVPLGA